MKSSKGLVVAALMLALTVLAWAPSQASALVNTTTLLQYVGSDFILFWPNPTRAYPGIPLDFRFVVYEANNQTLTWSLSNAPSGMTIDQLGHVIWTPSTSGTYSNITVTVTRPSGSVTSIQRTFSTVVGTSDFIFVSPTGNDTNSGTITSPLKTIKQAILNIPTGDGKTIYMRAGTYTQPDSWESTGYPSPWRSKNLTTSDPAEVRSYPGEWAVIDCQGTGMFQAGAASILDNFEVTNAGAGERGGIVVWDSNVVVRDTIVHDSHWATANNCTGYMVHGPTDTVLDNNIGYNNYDPNGTVWNSSNFLNYLDTSSAGIIYNLNNKSYGPSNHAVVGFKIKHAGLAQLVVHNCQSIGDSYGFAGAGQYCSARYCTFLNDAGNGITLGITDPNTYTVGPMLAERNTITNANADISVQDAYLAQGVNLQNNIVFNNVAAAAQSETNSNWLYCAWMYTTGGPTFTLTSAKNDFYGLSQNNVVRWGYAYDTFSQYKTAVSDTTSIFNDPLFVNFPNGNVNIPTNSPANYGSGDYAGAYPPGASLPAVVANRTFIIPPAVLQTAPTAVNDSYSLYANHTLTVSTPGVLSNDTGSGLTAVKVTNPSHGSVTLNSDGSFTYTPTTGYTGSDSYTYKAHNSGGDSNTATVTITVNTPPAPTAQADSYTTSQNTQLVVAAAGLLLNDTDSTGLSLTAVGVSNPSHGTVSVSSNGGFTYTPTTGYSGSDSFGYKAYNGFTYSTTTTASITITPSAPTAVNDSYSTSMNTQLSVTAPGVLANDTGSGMTAVKVANPSHGSVTLNSDGSFTYTPTTGYTGSDSYTYKAHNSGGDSNTATVNITINSSSTTRILIDVGNTLLSSTTTPNSDGRYWNNFTAYAGSPSVITSCTTSTGSLSGITLTRTADFYWYDTNSGITTSINGWPVAAAADFFDVASTTVPAAMEFSLLDTSGSKTYDLTVFGSTIDSGTTQYTVLASSTTSRQLNCQNNTTQWVTFSGLTPTAAGKITLQVLVVGNQQYARAPLNVMDLAINSAAPTAVNDSYTMYTNHTKTVSAPGVLANDTGSGLTAVKVTNPSHGSVTLNSNGSFTYTPTTGYSGSDSFTYKAHNTGGDSNTATVSFTINQPTRVLIDVGNSLLSSTTSPNSDGRYWNNFTAYTGSPSVITSCTTSTGSLSGITLTRTADFYWYCPDSYITTPINGWPVTAAADSLYVSSTTVPAAMEFSLLDTSGSKTYDLTVFGSKDNSGTTQYTVLASSTTSRQVNCQDNTTQWVTFSGLTPTAAGKITLQVLYVGSSGGAAPLNVMDLAIYDTSGLGEGLRAAPANVIPPSAPSGADSAATTATTPKTVATNANITVVPAAQHSALNLQVNFQPASVVAPQGYLVDSGLPFGKNSNGYSYGWTKNLSAFTIKRNNATSPDIRYDTSVMLVSGGTWEMAVPNGMYDVKIVAGGSGALASPKFTVEGVPMTQTVAKTAANWSEETVTVVVTDGRLTITTSPGSSICFLQITGR